MSRVLIHVQHLLGIGHLRRAAALARGLSAAGTEVVVASGGMPVARLDLGGAQLRQLPPARSADETFKILLDEHDRPIDDAWRARRRAALLALFEEVHPDALIVEMFPFGRRALRFELVPLLERIRAMNPKPEVFCSVRDILIHRPRPDREAEFLDTVRRHFDRILVHGDPRLMRLEESFPLAAAIADKLAYTGYLVEVPATRGGDDGPGKDEVIVSVGGGAVGEELLRTALAARPLTVLKDAPWRLLLGANLPPTLMDELKAAAPAGVVVESSRPDFVALLGRCRLSISQAGYNTLMELMAVGSRGVVVPFARGAETEQTQRAELLAARGLVDIAAEAGLTPERLADAVNRAAARPKIVPGAIDLDGLKTSVSMIRSTID
ncbi:MAG: glycosyl transferase [Alphaproteobacteria bacterium]|nr:glycosyl transferase [Alphaproteobacteria bacterium]